MTQELRKLAEEADSAMTYEREWTEFKKACTPDAILDLLDRVEKAEKDTERLDWVIRNRDMRVQGDDHRGWHVLDCSDGLTFVVREESSFRSAIDSAMEASK